jgi:hypothetical protein
MSAFRHCDFGTPIRIIALGKAAAEIVGALPTPSAVRKPPSRVDFRGSREAPGRAMTPERKHDRLIVPWRSWGSRTF